MKRKWLVVGIILLFIGTNIVPSVISTQTHDKNIITVDDEPGDADFTSIQEAVNHSNPGDTIEVYSGTYTEQDIQLEKEKLNLLGITHELGAGNDTGNPFIKGNCIYRGSIIRILANDVTISNFTVENTASATNYSYCIHVGSDIWKILNNITIRDCTICNSSDSIGILVYHYGAIWNLKIINNYLSHSLGISCTENPSNIENNSIIAGNIITDSYCGIFDSGFNGTISGNEITNCRGKGIYLHGGENKISGNRISNCSIGIQFAGSGNIIDGNDIDHCPISIQYGGKLNNITKNNFKNYTFISIWFERWFGDQFKTLSKSRWAGNYWDTWSGVGPKIILGLQVIPFGLEGHLEIPGFEFDRKPAKEPYDIPGTT
jgi:parallel beta-helix repeat protein